MSRPSDEDVLLWLEAQAAGDSTEPELAPELAELATELAPHVPEPELAPHVPELELAPESPQHEVEALTLRQAINANIKLLKWFAPQCDLYKLWVPLIAGPLEDGRQSRGEQTGPWNIASICTGSSPEDRTGGLFSTGHNLVFTCDPKDWSFKWMSENNYVQPRTHFVDLRDVAAGRPAFTAEGKKITLKQAIEGVDIHVLLAGISCCPNSFARTNRAEDIWSHPDTWMLPAFIDTLILTDAESGVLENVDGFMKVDKKTGISPIFRLAQLAEQKGVLRRWSMVVLVMDGKTFLVWDRHRVWILFQKRSSGEAFKHNVVAMIQDFLRNKLLLISKLSTQII